MTTAKESSAWSPFRLPVFRMLWVATVASNVGTWMHDLGAAWLMTSLSPSPAMVALVQTATTLPVFLLAVPAGALSDIVDRRRYLLFIQGWMAAVAVALGALALSSQVNEWSLVALTFAMGCGTAMMLPAWAAVTPELVPRPHLQAAIALNSLGINIARAIGPALAGVIVSLAGTGAVFVLNAVSYLGVILVLARWKREPGASELPRERFFVAVRSGLRFARHAPELQAAVVRGLAFFLFASASWALLPLVARGVEGGGPQTFGLLVASIGAGAVLGAVVLPKVRSKVSSDALVAAASVLYAATTLSLALLDDLALLCLAMTVSGIAWISVLSSLQVAAQMALPDWARSRGLSVFMTAFMGAMAGGSLLWGQVAERTSIPVALSIAAGGLIVAILFSWRWKISGFESIDLSPAMHWATPVVHDGVSEDRGPVLVTLRYRVRPQERAAFLAALRTLGRRRRRDGAFSWGVFEDTEHESEFLESFYAESWLDHLRQHERVTQADRDLQEEIQEFLFEPPKVSHFVAPRASEAEALSLSP
ncbi:MAG: MFS transporter [Acidobacteriota bacterium]